MFIVASAVTRMVSNMWDMSQLDLV